MTPTLGQTVLYIPLVNEPAQSFVAASAGQPPLGEAVVAPVPYPHGYRAATVVGFAGQPSEGRATLLVYKQPGDPFREERDAHVQRLAEVPYSTHGAPGTWTHEHEARALANPPKSKPAATNH